MKSFIDYIEETFQGEKDDGTLYRYKRLVMERMTERANEITHAGLQDEQVLYDLVVSEFPRLKENYQKFSAEERAKKREKFLNKFMIFGTVALILTLVIVYLAVSFLTDAWRSTWVIIVDGILAWVVFILSVFIRRVSGMRRIFHPIARVLLGISVMCVTTVLFLISMAVLHLPNSWLIYPFGVTMIYVADAIYATVTKQKLRIINYLIYIPAAMPMLYVFLGALDIIPWHPGWLLMPLAVLIDLIIVFAKMMSNKKYKYKPEVDAAWNEN